MAITLLYMVEETAFLSTLRVWIKSMELELRKMTHEESHLLGIVGKKDDFAWWSKKKYITQDMSLWSAL